MSRGYSLMCDKCGEDSEYKDEVFKVMNGEPVPEHEGYGPYYDDHDSVLCFGCYEEEENKKVENKVGV